MTGDLAPLPGSFAPISCIGQMRAPENGKE